ncbi:heavy metal sensor histidine kinase [Pseudomonas sp. LS1212]|uniref:heavy metal sensor histidine kinase n=1 Tax=Pseudomonas sp. LS1212 TaxID=2972478 RepID=UPI00215D10F9|nr:heavy metal sensor histidine kinase [Pseudomonas sp. LS1212]UVJ43088.1 heavy metal sensor histidine kinase [Pseudomonas sp. LS1212]
MKATRLSLRLGLTVSLMGAGLVVLLATLAVLALDHELNTRVERDLEKKMQQLQHNLSVELKANDLSLRPHALLDVVMGHDNLNLTIFGPRQEQPALVSLGAGVDNRHLAQLEPHEHLSYRSWTDSDGQRLLTASQLMRLQGREPVRVLLTVNRADDEQLLGAYLRSTVIALPLLLLLIGVAAWWLVQRGLLPLRQFRRVAAKVSAQDLSHRLSVDKLPQELSELAHGINYMLNRLDNGVQQLSQFSDDLAHELRTPISNLMGKAQVTLAKERPAEQYKAVLECSIEELNRVTRIISDMLFLAQVSHPAALAPFEQVVLEDEVQRVAELFSIAAEEKRIGLQISGRATVAGDRLMIQRALSNLLSNAIRHSPAGAQIGLDIEQHAEGLSVAVSNGGPGIAAEHLPHLFERFYRADNSRSRLEGGTGLGLAIVRSIMNQHQGTVEVTSVPDGLTVFRLFFPKSASLQFPATFSTTLSGR